MGWGCNHGPNEIGTLTCAGETPCSWGTNCNPITNCASCGCSPCRCQKGGVAVPAPFYDCSGAVQEEHSKPVITQSFATTVINSADFVIPACGQTATVPFYSLASVQIGSYFWNSTYGFFKVTSFDPVSLEVTLLNECFGENAAPGTVVPACSPFNVTLNPYTGNSCFSVDKFGAKGDGVTDDAAAIQAAIDAAVVSGGVVCFSGGKNYLVKSTLWVPITADNVFLEGYGALITGAVNDTILRISDIVTPNDHATNIGIFGLSIFGQGYTNAVYPTQNGIEINAVVGMVLRDVKVWNIPQTGIIGTKSPQSGSTYWEQVCFDHISVRFCGYQGVAVGETPGANAAGDDLTVINSLFNHCGEKIAANDPDGAVYLKVINLQMSDCEISGNYSVSHAGFGYRRGLIVRVASGCLAGNHYEGNGNNQAGSSDLLLDTDAHGLVISGSNHFGSLLQAPKYCIETTSRGNRIDGVTWCGDVGIHVYDYVINAVNAVDLQVGNIQNFNNPQIPPTLSVVNYNSGVFGNSNLVAHDHYVQTGRRRELFQTRYASSNPAEIVITGWGATATVTSVRAYDSHGDFTINATGGSQTNPATIEITFADGAWPSEPTCIMYQRNTGGGGTLLVPQVAINTTRILFTANSAPTNNATYTFTWQCIGME